MTPVFPSAVDPDIWFGGERVPEFEPLIFSDGLGGEASPAPQPQQALPPAVVNEVSSNTVALATVSPQSLEDDHRLLEQLTMSNARLQTMVSFLTAQLSELREDLRLLKQHPATLEMVKNKVCVLWKH
jgi:hypothetical protein